MIEWIPQSRCRLATTRQSLDPVTCSWPQQLGRRSAVDMCEASVTGPAASLGLPAAVCTSALIECRRLANCSHIAWLVELLGWSRLETGPRYQQNCTECHKEKARPIRSEPQESQAAPWRLQSIASGPGGIPATKRSPPNSGAYHVQESANNEERAKSHQEHSRLSICRCPAQSGSSIQAQKRSGQAL
jgi:hypothetical protein